MVRARPVIPALLLCAVLCASGCAGPAEGGGETPVELTVRRGDLRPHWLLTGELAAARADELKVPQTPSWQVQVRWMAPDGTAVRAGERVAELDNSAFTAELDDKRAKVTDAGTELARLEVEARSSLAEKQFAVEQRRSELAKARLAAAVPEDLLSLREHQDRELAVRRAEVALAKAEKDLAAQREAGAADLEVQRINLRRAERDVALAESAIDALILRAPRDGIVMAAQHPWEGRKLREGDNVWVGMTVAVLPDLSSLQVAASLSDVDDGRVRPGMEARVTLDAFPAQTVPGRVVDVAAVAQEAPRRPLLRAFPVMVRLERLDLQRMRPGLSVRVEVLGPQVRGALLAPRAGLDLSGPLPRARLAAGGVRDLRLGPCDASFCVVEQGLEEGARLQGGAG